jgi:hypothetical protein
VVSVFSPDPSVSFVFCTIMSNCYSYHMHYCILYFISFLGNRAQHIGDTCVLCAKTKLTEGKQNIST